MKVSTVLATKSQQLVTITPEAAIKDAVALLKEHNIGALLVLDEQEKLVGVISERDIVRRLVERSDVLSLTVADLMTESPITAVPQDDLMSVANKMTENRFRHMPILEGDTLVGIVSIGDVLKIQRDEYRGQIDTLEAQIMAE